MGRSEKNIDFWIVRAVVVTCMFLFFLAFSDNSSEQIKFVNSYTVISEMNELGAISNLNSIPEVLNYNNKLISFLDEDCLILKKMSDINKAINKECYHKIKICQTKFLIIKPLIHTMLFNSNYSFQVKNEVPLG